MAAMLAAIVSTLPTAPLDYRITEGGGICKVPEPARWLTQQTLDNQFKSLCNGNEHDLISLSPQCLRPDVVPGGGTLAEIVVRVDATPAFMEQAFARAFNLVRAVGPAARAYTGDCTTVNAGYFIATHYMEPYPDPPPPGAPRCAAGFLRTATHPAHPARIGWINYWSAETCERLGMTANDPRISLFARAAECPGGGLVLQLTAEPPDFTQPAHRARLDAAYDAFPTIYRAR